MRILKVSIPFCILFGWFVSVETSCVAESFTSEQIEFFEKDVRPLLVEHCYSCHSAQAKKLQAGLRLDSRQHVLNGGDSGAAAVPGKPDDSLLLEAVRYEGFEMPPRGKLSDADVHTLTKWVEVGLPWPEEKTESLATEKDFDFDSRKNSHWSWQPIANPQPPTVERKHWPINEIDNFILARLEEKQLEPAKQADKRSLIRRLYFDLIGLPPGRQAIHDFLDDDSIDAYEAVVDQLLASKHFGEKWARHWMDLVRYGDTLGHEFDYPLHHAFQYRDYLIRAFNEDVPYDQFVTEQIAGDLLAPPRLHATEKYNESIIGTGFWLLGETVHAPTDVRADEAGRIDNQVDVMTKTFLGLTVGCARCHDHKFDPIPTSDYYALTGFLQSSRRQEALLDPHGKIHSLSKQLQQINTEADLLLRESLTISSATNANVSKYLEAAHQVHSRKKSDLNEIATEFGIDSARLKRWLDVLQEKEVQSPSHPMYAWHRLAMGEQNTKSSLNSFRDRQKKLVEEFEILSSKRREKLAKTELYEDFDDGSYDGWYITGDAFGDMPTRAGQWNSIGKNGEIAQPGVAHSGLRSKRLQGVLRSPTFVLNHKQIHYRINSDDIQIRLIVDGYAMDVFNALLFQDITLENVKTNGQTRWVTQHHDLYHYVGHRAHIEIIDHSDGFAALDEIRFSDGGSLDDAPSQIAIRIAEGIEIKSVTELANRYQSIWQSACKNVDEADADTLSFLNWNQRHDLIETESISNELTAIQRKRLDIEKQIPNPIHVQAMTDGDSENDFIHIRGNHKNLGPVVPRRLLLGIDDDQTPITSGSGRLELAKRMVDPRNPFISRVIVNRLWHHLFGRGIVASVDDFGRMGQLPTHPQLLDWLAKDFVRNGWSTKHSIKTMVMSQTYRMSSRTEIDASTIAEKDAANDLLHKARIRRITAEAIRDSVLAVSGRLDDTLSGPSVPIHLSSFMEGRGRPAKSGPVDGDGRRSVYLEVRRNFLSPMMLAFDMPSPFNTMGRRSTSNVPAQSLMLMNNPFVLQEAKRWANRIVAVNETIDERINSAFETALGRLPTASQSNQLRSFVAKQSKLCGTDENDLQVWSDVCHVIMNMKEFIYLN